MEDEEISIEGYAHKSVATKYFMKRRRSLLATKDKQKVEQLFKGLPRKVIVKGKQVSKTFKINWEKVGTTEFEGAKFTFTLEQI